MTQELQYKINTLYNMGHTQAVQHVNISNITSPVAALFVCFFEIKLGTIRPSPVESIYSNAQKLSPAQHANVIGRMHHILAISYILYISKKSELTVIITRALRAPESTIDRGCRIANKAAMINVSSPICTKSVMLDTGLN